MNVLPPTEFSDHSVIWTGFKSKVLNYNVDQNEDFNYEMLPGKYNLESGSQLDFVNTLAESNTSCMINQFLLEVNNPTADINTLSTNLNNIILQSANKCFYFKICINKKNGKKRYKKKWFNGNCLLMKRELNNLGKMLQQNPKDHNINYNYHRLRKEYKNYLKIPKEFF